MLDKIKKSLTTHNFFLDLIRKVLVKVHICNDYTSVRLRFDYHFYRLNKKYKNFDEKDISLENSVEGYEKYIWVCWFQGMESAPLIVKKCVQSIKNNLPEAEIVIIDENNYRKYVDLPKYIIEKYNKKIITRTHFSDILRFALLHKYGGMWIDATVFCTGNSEYKYITANDFFTYQDGWFNKDTINMGSWLIFSKPNNKLVNYTLKLLFKYWSEFNYLYDYFLVHIFFRIATNKYAEEWDKVPFSFMVDNHILFHSLFKKFNSTDYERIKGKTDFHKLSYKFDEKNMKGTFYEKIIQEEYR